MPQPPGRITSPRHGGTQVHVAETHKDLGAWAATRLKDASRGDFRKHAKAAYSTASSARRVRLQRALGRAMGKYFSVEAKP